MLGWEAIILNTISDEAIAKLLGLNRLNDFEIEEKETPDLLAVIVPLKDTFKSDQSLKQESIQKIENGKWFGKARIISVIEL